EVGYVQFDAGSEVLADIRTNKPLSEWIVQAVSGTDMAARLKAVRILAEQEETPEIRNALIRALGDEYDFVRLNAIAVVAAFAPEDVTVRRALVQMASEDSSARVRAAAVSGLSAAPPEDALVDGTLRDALRDSSYAVVAAAVRAYGPRRPEAALTDFQHLFAIDSWRSRVELALLDVLPDIGLDERAVTLLDRFGMPERDVIVRLGVARTLGRLGLDFQDDRMTALSRRLLEDVSESVRFAAATSLQEADVSLSESYIRGRLAEESSERVREALSQLLSDREHE
ncbi:MAG: HEAT repeat domain-containing protein, partial [Bacteroidota bacterium]